jgi:hypothetical protein
MRHPEYADKGENAAKLDAALVVLGRRSTFTAEDLEAVHGTLRGSGMLQLNQKVLDEQKREELAERASQPGEMFDEAEAYAMPMAQLERKVKAYL